jgi:N-methylhydantoinase A
MQSNGGAVAPALAAREPVRTILSGPRGGVVGAAQVAARLGLARRSRSTWAAPSTDVALIDGECRGDATGRSIAWRFACR